MAEYIEREALIKRLEASPIFSNFATGGIFIRDGVTDIIKKQPAADVVEVVHGEWINDFGSYSTMHCSKCEWRVPYIEDYWAIQELYSSLHNCPNCGAKMDGERGKEE